MIDTPKIQSYITRTLDALLRANIDAEFSIVGFEQRMPGDFIAFSYYPASQMTGEVFRLYAYVHPEGLTLLANAEGLYRDAGEDEGDVPVTTNELPADVAAEYAIFRQVLAAKGEGNAGNSR